VSDATPGKGFFGWLGRQVGHVKKAVQADVEKPAPKIVYRENRTEEQQLPDRPGVKFRRTVIDEVIVDPQQKSLAAQENEIRNSKSEIGNKSE
jgi:hypothetical protein